MNGVHGFDVVMERLRVALGLRNNKELALALGLKPNAFYNRRTSGSLPWENVVALALQRELSIDWIMLGVGQPKSGKEVKPVAEVDAILLAEISGELERATPPGSTYQVARAAFMGGLCAHIYNRVVFDRKPKLRTAKIRSLAHDFVLVSRLHGAADSLLKSPPTASDRARKKKRA